MKNWKTTLAGWGFGAANMAASYYQNGKFAWQPFLVSVGFGILGTFSKDSNVTGGTVQQ